MTLAGIVFMRHPGQSSWLPCQPIKRKTLKFDPCTNALSLAWA
jgi:hypothetical protein